MENQRSVTEDKQQRGYLYAFVSSFGSGLSTVIGKWNLRQITPLLLNCLIFSIATLILFLWLLPRNELKQIKHLSSKGWFWIVMFSVFSWIAIMAFWAGVQKIDPSLASFVHRMEVPIAILLGVIVLGEKFKKIEFLGILLAMLGILIMQMTLRVEYTYGFWLVLVSSIFFGLTELFSKIAVKHVEPVILAFIRNAFLALLYWLAFLIIGQDFHGLNKVWLGVIVLGFAGPILSRMVYLMALKRMELSKVAAISQTQPLFVIILSFVFLNQLPSFREMIGGFMILAGCLMMVLSQRNNHDKR